MPPKSVRACASPKDCKYRRKMGAFLQHVRRCLPVRRRARGLREHAGAMAVSAPPFDRSSAPRWPLVLCAVAACAVASVLTSALPAPIWTHQLSGIFIYDLIAALAVLALWHGKMPPIKIQAKAILWGIGAGVGIFCAILALHALTPHGEIGRAAGRPPVIPTVLLTVMIAPVVEELLFRSTLMTALLEQKRTVVAVLLSATLFALAHMHLTRFADLFLAGLVLAVVFAKTRSTACCIAAHMTVNVLGAVVVLMG